MQNPSPLTDHGARSPKSSARFGCLVILSGGQDSTTCLYWAKKRWAKVHAITFDYHQRHDAEIAAARKVAHMAEIESHEIIELGPVLKGTSPLISADSPAQYESWQKLPGGLEATFVPCRNALFLTIAANRAYALGTQDVIIGVSQEDYGGYPDCRSDFLVAMGNALAMGMVLSMGEPMGEFRIHAPLQHRNKAQTVEMSTRLPGCYAALAYTHTAYDGAYPPTGKDHASLLRAKGFELSGYPDPLVLRAVKEGLMPMPETENYSPAALAKAKQILSA